MYLGINISNENDFFFVINWYTNESTIKKNSKILIGPHEKNGLLPTGILDQNSQKNLLSFKLFRVIPFNLFSFGKYQLWFVPFCSVPFPSFSFHTDLNTNYLRFITFLFVPFHFIDDKLCVALQTMFVCIFTFPHQCK